MIAYLSGIILEKEPPSLVLDVNGVGYQLEASMNTFYALSTNTKVGAKVSLHVHTVVREDAFLLYGFSAKDEREVFKTLLKISGVGPRVALAILSTLTAQELAQCVMNEDAATLVRVPGIGRKTADRLLVELRDRLPVLYVDEQTNATMPTGRTNMAINDATSALIALGFGANDASCAVRAIKDGATKSSEELIRLGLKALS